MGDFRDNLKPAHKDALHRAIGKRKLPKDAIKKLGDKGPSDPDRKKVEKTEFPLDPSKKKRKGKSC